MMSEGKDDPESSAAEVEELVRKLNMTYDDAFQWTSKRAQKEHTDLFGETVQRGDRYWRMRMGGAFSNDLKLTDGSMRRFLYGIFSPQPKWEQQAEVALTRRLDFARSLIDHLRQDT